MNQIGKNKNTFVFMASTCSTQNKDPDLCRLVVTSNLDP